MSEPKRLPRIAAYDLPTPAELPVNKVAWAINPARAALLIHDMQNYFVSAFPRDASPIEPTIANLARLIAAARAAGAPVFYTAQHGDQDRRDRGLQAEFWGPGMKTGQDHEPIIAELAPAPGDFKLTKHRYSAFQRSNLETLMRARGRDQLIVGGVYAHIGCMLTVAEAFQRDIEAFLVADALGDFSRADHDRALVQTAACTGVVATTDQVLEALA